MCKCMGIILITQVYVRLNVALFPDYKVVSISYLCVSEGIRPVLCKIYRISGNFASNGVNINNVGAVMTPYLVGMRIQLM